MENAESIPSLSVRKIKQQTYIRHRIQKVMRGSRIPIRFIWDIRITYLFALQSENITNLYIKISYIRNRKYMTNR